MSTATAPPADKMLDKVAKLLTKAEAFGVTAEEAEALSGKAAELMARYGIEKHMLAAAQAASQPAKPGDRLIKVYPPFHHQKKDMLAWVGDAMRLHPVLRKLPTEQPGKYRDQLAVELFGSPADIDRCALLFGSLLAQATRLLRDEMPAGATSSYKQSWLNGFAARISGRVMEAEQQAVTAYDTEHRLTAGPQSAELVLASWDDLVMAHRASLHPNLGKAKKRATSGSGFGAGYAAAGRASITTQRALPQPAR